jgi:hypothetical protein
MLPLNVWHRCAYCGDIFRTLDELKVHIAVKLLDAATNVKV